MDSGWLYGIFDGAGSWHDSTGKSQNYRVHQIHQHNEHGFEIILKHDFEDGSVVRAHLAIAWTTAYLFSVSMAGASLGNGYLMDDYCHYHLDVEGAFVEVGYILAPEGIRVFGSSTRNAEGHYIAWRETLRRVAAGP